MNQEWILTGNYDLESPCKCDRCEQVIKCSECAVQYDSLDEEGKTWSSEGAICPVHIEAVKQCKRKRGRHLFAQNSVCRGSPSRRENLNQKAVRVMQSL
ncbi:hypothetical protein CL633_01900 [bacterium]|nr:hypothetical protein [bacterium]|tara:strand:- start:10458 stop:10754 length:297 start_codon:yes stop_codon:yes gene_type:complete